MSDDKLKADLIKQFKSEFPDSPLEDMEQSELAEIKGWITTGNYALNWIISKGLDKGLPLGKVVVFSGDPASGKCAHEDTEVKILNQNKKSAKEFLSNYDFETTNNSDKLEYDCVSFIANDKEFVIPEKCQVFTKNRGFIFAENLNEKDEIFYNKILEKL